MDPRELWRANGEAVRHHRHRLALSRFQLAIRAGVSPRSVMKAERGGVLFPSTLSLIAVALDVPVEALRLREEKPHRPRRRVRRHVEMARRFYEMYNTLWLAGDFSLLRRELPHEMDPAVVWSSSTNVSAKFDSTFQGHDGVRQFLDFAFETCARTTGMELEEIHPVGDRHVIVRYADRVFYRPYGRTVTGSGVHVFMFDEGRLAQLHQSCRILGVTPADQC